jgi:hypothetical protein
MDIQKMIDDLSAAREAERMKTSDQLMLIELIYELEKVSDKTKQVFYDNEGLFTTGIDSWRGIYAQLALDYSDVGDSPQYTPKTVEFWLDRLNKAIGETFQGYKGGDFTMHKTTPIWVANYGSASGFRNDSENDLWYQGVVGVKETDEKVLLLTQPMEA